MIVKGGRLVILPRRDPWVGEFFMSAFGTIGWVIISVVTPSHIISPSEEAFKNVSGSIEFLRMWLIVFSLLHLYGLLFDNRGVRIAGAACLCWAVVTIAVALVGRQHWPNGLSFYVAAAGVYVAAVAYQTYRFMEERKEKAALNALPPR